jgi:predicted DCC family thiol-disulfide oxidoreductase YuxK
MHLPDPDERPAANLVIYDGQCKFCTKQVKRVAQFDLAGLFSFISLHDPRVSQRFPNLSHQQLMDQMWVVDPTGRQYGGTDAVRLISRKLWTLWPLAVLLHLPGTGWFWRAAYRGIARIRYRLGGRCENDQCQVHFK